MTEPKPSTIVLNGFWAKIAQGVLIAAVLAGAGGLIIAIRMDERQMVITQEHDDHEKRLRTLESHFTELRQGIAILIERTEPRK